MRWTSLVLFTLLGLFLVWFGATYATVDTMLWFHAAAVPETARASVAPLYFALMNLIGGSSAALGVLVLYVTWMPLRLGVRGAAVALVAVLALAIGMAAVTAEELAAATASPTSWHLMGILLVIAVAALGAHVFANFSSRPRRAQPLAQLVRRDPPQA
jgi:hypothetical protein